jgi:hypothetical protein
MIDSNALPCEWFLAGAFIFGPMEPLVMRIAAPQPWARRGIAAGRGIGKLESLN